MQRLIATVMLALGISLASLASSSTPAEARRGGLVAGLIVGAVVGGVVAHELRRERRRAYYYHSYRPVYYRPAYHRPVYYRYY